MSAVDELKPIPHLVCDDSWYSCPASGECSNDNAGDECDCGADYHNAQIDAAIAELQAELTALKAAPNYAAQATVECAEYTIAGLLAELAALQKQHDGLASWANAKCDGLSAELAALRVTVVNQSVKLGNTRSQREHELIECLDTSEQNILGLKAENKQLITRLQRKLAEENQSCPDCDFFDTFAGGCCSRTGIGNPFDWEDFYCNYFEVKI